MTKALPAHVKVLELSSGNRIILHGLVLDSYCNGYFGEDYGEKRIEEVGHDWIVVRNEENRPLFATFDNSTQMCDMIQKWVTEDDDSH